MLTLDNVLVSVPNQELLKTEIDNYGKKRIIRRSCTVTPGFEYDSAIVEKALLEAAKGSRRVSGTQILRLDNKIPELLRGIQSLRFHK